MVNIIDAFSPALMFYKMFAKNKEGVEPSKIPEFGDLGVGVGTNQPSRPLQLPPSTPESLIRKRDDRGDGIAIKDGYVTPLLLDALKMVESSGNPNAISPKGAQGLYQVMPRSGKNPGFGIKPLAGPEDQPRFAADYLNTMLKRYGDLDHALMAYNWGPGSVDKWVSSGMKGPVPRETLDYIKKIRDRLAMANAEKEIY